MQKSVRTVQSEEVRRRFTRPPFLSRMRTLMLKKLENFSLPAIEEKVLAFWSEHNIFAHSIGNRKGKKRFVFYEGPPTANGRPGIHHVLARAFKDVICRYKTMRGFSVPRKGGWDTHGLPVELEVEKQLGLKSKKEIETYGMAAFNRACRESVWKYKDEWEKLTARIGFWLDMEHPYVTYENPYIESLWSILASVWKKKLLYKGHKVVPWCTRCGTALSSHELAQGYRSVEEESVYLKFKLKKGQKFGAKKQYETKDSAYILSWTTTPWTLPGNVALAVAPKVQYAAVRVDGVPELFILAESLVDSVFRGQAIERVHDLDGSALVGLEYEPLFDIAPLAKEKTAYAVYPADFVTTTDGTGVVHTAVMYGEDDYRLGKEVGLPEFHTVGLDGRFVEEVPGLAGMPVKTPESDAKIFAHLKAKKFLLKTEPYTHDYPFCWRCQTPLLYYARDSWFIRMSALRAKLQKENETINWVPEHLKEGRFGEWLREVKDWAISRERYWGTPLPLWVCDACGHTHAVGNIAELEEKLPQSTNRYILVRHGEAENNVRQILSPWPETEPHHLTLTGRVEVEDTAKKLSREHVDVIISSDLTRTKETAEIIAKATGAHVVFDERLRERNVGFLDGEPISAYRAQFPSELDRFEKRPRGGESMTDLRARGFAFFKDAEQRYHGKTIVVVGHGDPLWMLRAAMQGWENRELVTEGTAAYEGYPKKGGAAEVVLRNVPRNELGELDLHRPYIDAVTFPCRECGKGTMKRIPEVVDVWFDSGAMPFAQAHFPFETPAGKLAFPADFISEGIDQTRGWFYTLLAIGVLAGKGTPFKNVISLGLVLDKNGQKMSKSKGNVVSPWDMVGKYGADAVRWYFFTVNPPGEPKNFDEAELGKVVRQFILLIYNSFVFLETYGAGAKAAKVAKPTNVLDRWVLSRLNRTIVTATAAFDAYDVGTAGRAIGDFAGDLSRWYIRRSRRRLQRPDPSAAGKADYAAAVWTLRFTLTELAKLLAPFMPFFAEALWKSLSGDAKASVHLEDWPKADKKYIDAELESAMAEVRRVASLALAVRASAGRKVRQPLASLTLNTTLLKGKTDLLEILQDEVNVKEVRFDTKGKDNVALDTTLTHELEEEGCLRELVRTVQGLRQDAKLEPKDEVSLYLEMPDELQHVVEANKQVFLRDVKASSVEYKRGRLITAELETKLDEWTIWVGLQK
jgi:isoleucyl-tRNA synthetase